MGQKSSRKKVSVSKRYPFFTVRSRWATFLLPPSKFTPHHTKQPQQLVSAWLSGVYLWSQVCREILGFQDRVVMLRFQSKQSFNDHPSGSQHSSSYTLSKMLLPVMRLCMDHLFRPAETFSGDSLLLTLVEMPIIRSSERNLLLY
jgi:hypothetical protein